MLLHPKRMKRPGLPGRRLRGYRTIKLRDIRHLIRNVNVGTLYC